MWKNKSIEIKSNCAFTTVPNSVEYNSHFSSRITSILVLPEFGDLRSFFDLLQSDSNLGFGFFFRILYSDLTTQLVNWWSNQSKPEPIKNSAMLDGSGRRPSPARSTITGMKGDRSLLLLWQGLCDIGVLSRNISVAGNG
ncbi:hypothetical protein RchiOBHm_Chr6g0269841 [Rosa chinensis]|uniref:Uncharacterized protein n=1 Tax=Rosa chinensis TaxID=74649 RepID=A0A2P6PQH9_ROSCH|nr:hypothetical protein RchiOBHm_Chr6g0269841 [Rosa chinensis]